ncbi:MAG: APC family permease [Gemmatimonadota bacterium]
MRPSAPSALRRNLSLRDLVVFGLLFIGPLAPVGVFGVLDARANGAVALVYVIATLAMACTAWSYAQMSRHVPHAGSVFAYATEGLGVTAGFIAGWMVMLDYLLIPAVAYLFSGIALHALVPSIPAWVFTIVAFAATTVLNLIGVQLAARVGRTALAAEILVLAIFIISAIVVLARQGAVRPWLSPFVGVGITGGGEALALSTVAGAVSIAVLSFLGFDAIASFAEESAGDVRQVGRAIVICLVIAGTVFIAQSYLVSVLSTITPAELAADPARQGTTFYDVTRLAIGGWLATVLALTKAIGPAFSAMTGQAAAARLLYGMAREGRLPASLAMVDPKHGVPRTALATVALLTLGCAVWAARRDDGLSVLVSIVDIGALTAFILLHASVVGYFVVRRRATSTAWHVALPVAGALVSGWVLIEASTLAQVVGAIWFGLGVIAFVLSGRTVRSL